jgi:hypothetical protein
MSPRKPIVHVQQQAVGFCLPACAQMALAQLGIQATQAQLARTLGTRPGIGTPFPNITQLSRWRVNVQTIEWQSIDAVVAALATEVAVISLERNGGTGCPATSNLNDLPNPHTAHVRYACTPGIVLP